MSPKLPKPEELAQYDFNPPADGWMNKPTEIREGMYLNPSAPEKMEYLGMPNPRRWSPQDEDWKLPDNWKEIIYEGMRERLDKYRSFRLFMDICVRCGACADKCHFFLGSGDPKNMPVLRAELLRAVYRKDFTLAGKIMGKMVGGRELTIDVIKEWFYYFFQCTECRRCSVFCPYGIDTAEITIIGRELLNLLGINAHWILNSVADCQRTGNHLGLQPHALMDDMEYVLEEIEDLCGRKIDPPFNRKGAEILFIIPSGDFHADPGIYTLMGYLLLFDYLDLDYTFSTYASEGGNFGLFTSHEMMKRLNFKMYHEAKRLGSKWILGGECGHMWRVVQQYMDTHNGPADFLETPVSPITGTRFEHAKSTSMIHICEFTADLIKNNKLKLDPRRNDNYRVTFHDSCNPARAMGMLDEPRYILNNVCNHFTDMPENTIREQTFCCGSGAGLGATEDMELRMRGGFPRANAVKHVVENNGVNTLSCICAIDRAVFPELMKYWVPGTKVCGLHELVGNALVFDDGFEREMDLRGEELPETDDEPEEGEPAKEDA